MSQRTLILFLVLVAVVAAVTILYITLSEGGVSAKSVCRYLKVVAVEHSIGRYGAEGYTFVTTEKQEVFVISGLVSLEKASGYYLVGYWSLIEGPFEKCPLDE